MTTFDKKIRTPRGHPLFGSLFAKIFEVCQILFPPNDKISRSEAIGCIAFVQVSRFAADSDL